MEFYFRMFWRCSKLLRSKRRHWKPSPLSIPQISWCVMNLKTASEICSSGDYIHWWRRQFGNVSGYDNFNFQSIYSQSASEWIIKKCAEGAFEAQFDFQIFKQIWRHRSSRSNSPKVFCEKVVLTKFAIFTAKHVLETLFNKVAAYLKARNFIKKRLQHRCFPANIAKFFKSIYFEEYLWTAASVKVSLKSPQVFWSFTNKTALKVKQRSKT